MYSLPLIGVILCNDHLLFPVYERAFRNTAPEGKLHKEDLMIYLNKCDLWPTQADVNKSFDTIFRGKNNTTRGS